MSHLKFQGPARSGTELAERHKTTAHTPSELDRVIDIVKEWQDAPAWPGPDPYEFMNRIAKVFE